MDGGGVAGQHPDHHDDAMTTPSGLFILQPDGTLVGLAETEYDSEAFLQELLAKFPELMPGDQIDSASPRRWLLITRELGVPDDVDAANRWSLDHLFVDQDGVPTLVEVKRSSDTRIRREVVGQMLDYAANAVVHWPIEAIRAAFERRCEKDGKDPMQEVQAFLGSDAAFEAFWVGVKTNLQAGKIRLLFVSDTIPPELRRIVEFLNEQMDPAEVLAIEVRQYTGKGLRTLLPRVFGQTALAEQRKGTGGTIRGRTWDEAAIFARIAERGNERDTRVARKLFDWAKTHMTRIDFGAGAKNGSFIPVMDLANGKWFGPFRVFTGYTGVYVEIPLGGSGFKAPPFDEDDGKREFVRRLNAIPGITIPEKLRGYPGIYPDALGEGEALSKFLDTIAWAMEQVRAAALR